jgi:RimJ/RimL family protein N-acetyltransferase
MQASLLAQADMADSLARPPTAPVAAVSPQAFRIRSTATLRGAHDPSMASSFWPLFGLRLETPRLVLRTPTDRDFPALFDAIDAGIHDPAVMPFLIPWTDAEPEARRRSAAQHWWATRAAWSLDEWTLNLAVFLDGAAVGMQSLSATSFPRLRSVSTGSWVTRPQQGRGIGREMRAAVLHFAFAVLGADEARSGAFTDNPASLAVSRALGYEHNGTRRALRRGEPAETIDLLLTRARWLECPCAVHVEVHGFDACRSFFEP